MWKSLTKIVSTNVNPSILIANNVLHQQLRTTFILKRKFAPFAHKKNSPRKTLRSKHYLYELIEDTNCRPQKQIDVILTSHVDGLGNVGDKVAVKQNYAYHELLLPGLAVYATPEAEKKYESGTKSEEIKFSSPTASITMNILSRVNLSVVMNKEQPWTLKPWHIKASFRKCGYIVPENAITLPDKPISGPDMNIEDKIFNVTVTINNTEKVPVKCRIHHWSTDVKDRLPFVHEFWKEEAQSIFEDSLPKNDNIS